MKKSFIATAVAAGLLASGAAQAEPKLYGILHLSIDTFNDTHYSSTGSVVKVKSRSLQSSQAAKPKPLEIKIARYCHRHHHTSRGL